MSIRKKILITTITISLFLVGVVYFIIFPAIKDIREINNSILREKKDLELKYQRGLLIRKVSKNFEKIKPVREKLYSMFIPLGQELKFIENLENIVQKYNLTQEIQLLDQDQKEKNKENEIKKTLGLRITLTGDFVQIIKYLNDIEKLNYYFNIHNIVMESKNSELGTVNALLEGRAYSLL